MFVTNKIMTEMNSFIATFGKDVSLHLIYEDSYVLEYLQVY